MKKDPIIANRSYHPGILSWLFGLLFISPYPLQSSELKDLISQIEPVENIHTPQYQQAFSNGSDAKEIQLEVAKGESLWQTNKRESYRIILKVFERLEHERTNDTVLGDAYHLLGKLLIDKGDLMAGIDTLKRCLKIKMRAYGSNDPKLSKTINYIGLGFRQAMELDSAMFYYNWAARVVTDHDLVNKDLYFTYQNRGLVQVALGHFGLSYKYFEKALMVLDSIATPQDDVMRANFYKSFGLLTTLNGKLNEANEYYNLAEKIYLNHFGANYIVLADIYTLKGLNVYYNYDFDEAIIHFSKAINILNTNNAPNQSIITLYSNLSTVSYKKQDYHGSINYCRKGFSYKPEKEGKLILLLNLSRSFSKLEVIDSAEYYFTKSIKYANYTKLLPDKILTLHSEYANYLFSNQRYDESKFYLSLALEESNNFYGVVSEISAELISKLGEYHLMYTKKMDSALYYFDKSIAIWDQRLSQPDQYAKTWTVAETGFMETYSAKAKLFREKYRLSGEVNELEKCIDIYRTLFGYTDMITGKITREGTLLFNNKIKSVYIQAIEVAYMLYLQTGEKKYLLEAFQFSEKSKSALLLSTIKNNRALQVAGVPESILTMEAELQEEINSLRKLRDDEQSKPRGSKSKISFFNSTLLDLYRKHDSLIAFIEAEYPKYYTLKYDHSVIDLESVRKSLDVNEIILEYTLADSNLFIIAIDQVNTDFLKIPVDSSFYTALEYLTNLKNKRISYLAEENPRDFVKHSGLLWKYLMGPVDPLISNKHLIIIPDEQLGYLSFDILVNPWRSSAISSFRELPYLIKEHTLSYAYSSTLRYGSFFIKNKTASANAITFATDYQEDPMQLPHNDEYGVLNHAIIEAKQVSQIMNGKTFTNEKATKEAFLTQAPKYKVIHLALHTKINDSLPMFSELIFSGEEKDSLLIPLRTYELYGMDLNADLVTLSACNSGTGKLQRGEGIMNLAKGFLYAGVPTVIMTLWEVQDESSTLIMKQFYSYLKKGFQKDKAMQMAKLDYLANANMLKSHPYFWSLFVVSGETSPVSIQEGKINYYVYITLGIALLLSLFAMIKRKSAGTN
jgi:CHAT domain-containing protein